MKRRLAPPPPDYRVDRSRWADLITAARRARSTQAAADLDALSEKALAAETCFAPLAAFPRGLVCRNLSRIGWTYGRQTDPALRAEMGPMLDLAVKMAADLFDATETPAPPPVETGEAPAARLPYSDA